MYISFTYSVYVYYIYIRINKAATWRFAIEISLVDYPYWNLRHWDSLGDLYRNDASEGVLGHGGM